MMIGILANAVNVTSAALILESSGTIPVASLGLAAINLFFLMVLFIKMMGKRAEYMRMGMEKYKFLMCMAIMILNIAFDIMIIQYYTSNMPVSMELMNLSYAIIAFDGFEILWKCMKVDNSFRHTVGNI